MNSYQTSAFNCRLSQSQPALIQQPASQLHLTVNISDGCDIPGQLQGFLCAGLRGDRRFLMPSRQRSNPLLGGMDSPSPHIHRHRGSHSSSISEQRSTAVCTLALNYSAARCPGHQCTLLGCRPCACFSAMPAVLAELCFQCTMF